MKPGTLVIVGCGMAAAVLMMCVGFAQDEPKHALLGKPAPAVTLDLLDGGKFNLAEHKDKDIVVMDFWATWCPPCRMTMPILMKVIEEYKGKGVSFCAVDIKDSPDKIKAFMKDIGLTFMVALDKAGDAAAAYQAEYIPQSVIVGKDGIVQAVHVGLLPDLKERLKKDLDTLLAGKSLVKQEAKGSTPKPKK
jgi:thiol-disulfide isomerase/thioredoxin